MLLLPRSFLSEEAQGCLEAVLNSEPGSSYVAIGRAIWPEVQNNISLSVRTRRLVNKTLEEISARWEEQEDPLIDYLKRQFEDFEGFKATIKRRIEGEIEPLALKKPCEPPKNCPRCKGSLIEERDQYGRYLTCLVCGFHYDLDAPAAPVSKEIAGHRTKNPRIY